MQLRSRSIITMADDNTKGYEMHNAPKFSGAEDVSDYLLKLDLFVNYNTHLSADQHLSHAIYALTGDALNTYKSYKDSITSIKDLNCHFTKQYGILMHPQVAQEKLFQLKQSAHETVRDFASKIRNAGSLIKTVDSSLPAAAIEALQTTAFMRGLVDKIKDRIYEKNPKKFQEAIDAAILIENLPSVNKASPINSRILASQLANMQQNFEDSVAKRFDKLEETAAKVNVVKSNENKSNSNQCQLCDKFGHEAKTCYSNPNFKNNNPRSAYNKQRPSFHNNHNQPNQFNNRPRPYNNNWRPNKHNRGSYNNSYNSSYNNRFPPYQQRNPHFNNRFPQYSNVAQLQSQQTPFAPMYFMAQPMQQPQISAPPVINLPPQN